MIVLDGRIGEAQLHACRTAFRAMEDQNGVAYANFIAMRQGAVRCGNAIHECAVTAIEIHETEFRAVLADLAMAAGDQAVQYGNIIRQIPADRDLRFFQEECLTL